MSEEEIWKDVEGDFLFKENYECSNMGRIRNKLTNRILKGCLSNGKYPKVHWGNSRKKALSNMKFQE